MTVSIFLISPHGMVRLVKQLHQWWHRASRDTRLVGKRWSPIDPAIRWSGRGRLSPIPSTSMVKPLLDTRIGDVLGTPGAALVATCRHCQRASYVPRGALQGRHPLSRVVDLEGRFRCSECGQSAASVWVQWP